MISARPLLLAVALAGLLLPPAARAAAGPVLPAGCPEPEVIDASIERGLQFLETTQLPNGAFETQFGRTAGIVSLAGLACLAKGYLPGRGPRSEVIDRSIAYVLSMQDEKGYMGGHNGKMYSHGIATLFLAEVSGMVDTERQAKVREALSRAVKLILTAQSVRKQNSQNEGGWRYEPTSADSDLSCSGWSVMALRSARLNGALVPSEAIEKAVGYIRRCGDPQTGSFGYQNPGSHSVTLTGAALLCLELTGHHGEEVNFRAGNFILNAMKRLPNEEHALYGNYYNAQGTFQLGGLWWQRYAEWMYGYWLPKQQADGSWVQGTRDPAYCTAMCLLALTVPYRQLPIYQRDETVDETEDAP